MHLEKPPISFHDLLADPARLAGALPKGPSSPLLDDYRPWNKVKHIARDIGMDPAAAWAMVKASRIFNWREVDQTDIEGEHFGFCAGAHLVGPLHRIDRDAGGTTPGGIGDDAQQRRLHIESLMGEAAESSLIEGAATTRKVAMEMLRAGRPPRQRGEQMVLNNYIAMQQIKDWLSRPLSVEMLLELQAILVENTVDDPTAKGRLRRADENVGVVDARDESVIYTPPPADGLPDRLRRLCDFANKDHTGPEFIHPIVKACILHFMIGYEHPFVDGNGRTARAAFYWLALKHGYGIFEYLSISEVIRHGYARYPQAYIDTEQDDGDLTYFVLYKLDIILQAMDHLEARLRDEEQKIERSQRMLRLSGGLNLRQRLLLEHALCHPMTHFTAKSHMNSSGISKNTARGDLDDLVRRKLMVTAKGVGKEVVYLGAPSLGKRLASKNRA